MNREQSDTVNALRILSSICERNGIDYYLLAGSCLGGVRHSGMIPWDDDIDIGIPNEQYQQFSNMIKTQMPKPYTWINEQDNYPRFYGKILKDNYGCIDCFRLVKFPDNKFMQRLVWISRKILYRAINMKYCWQTKKEFRRFLSNPISSLIGLILSYEQLNSIMRKIEGYSEKHAGSYRINLHSIYSMEKELIPQTMLDNKGYIRFEDAEYPTVGDTHAYLTNLYGDYMTPPPEHERNNKRHTDTFSVKER